MPWRAACRVACRLAEFRTNWAIMLAADAVPLVPPSVSLGGVCISGGVPAVRNASRSSSMRQVLVNYLPQTAKLD